MIMVSACLLGFDCKYNGKNNHNASLCELLSDQDTVAVCPEVLGGSPVPRPPCEICGGTGSDVLDGRAGVVNSLGQDVTPLFIKGAFETLQKAKDNHVDLVILKSRSPSCGIGQIYDGTFSSKLLPGDGVTSALLKKEGYTVLSDEEFATRGR